MPFLPRDCIAGKKTVNAPALVLKLNPLFQPPIMLNSLGNVVVAPVVVKPVNALEAGTWKPAGQGS